jgi:glutaredoxin 3
MANIIIYTKANCPYCDWAKQLLTARNATYTEVAVDTDAAKREEMERLSGRRTVPQIFINDQSIGGYDDLSALAKAGELDKLLTA